MSNLCPAAIYDIICHVMSHRAMPCHTMPCHVMTCHDISQHSTARHGTARHGTAKQSKAKQSKAKHGTARHGTAQQSKAKRSMSCCRSGPSAGPGPYLSFLSLLSFPSQKKNAPQSPSPSEKTGLVFAVADASETWGSEKWLVFRLGYV